MRRRTIEALCFILCFWVSTAQTQGLQKLPLYLNQKEIWVQVAKTAEERAKGLMGRLQLPQDEGMLFIFEEENYHSFWMKNTRIPLSIAFIDREGKIVKITDMEPFSLESHGPPCPIRYALEMKQGWFSTNGIRMGDVMTFSK